MAKRNPCWSPLHTLTCRTFSPLLNASFQFFDLGATLVGSLIGGILGELLGLRPVLAFGAGGTLLSALVLGLSPVRKLKEIPAV